MPELPSDDSLRGWVPRRRPERAVVRGESVRLEPLDPRAHAGLYAAANDSPGDEHLWSYMPYGPFDDDRAFAGFLGQAARSSDPLFFALVDVTTERPFGMASYLRITPEHGVIEVGDIWFGPAYQRSRHGTEAIFLLARHAFDDLAYRRLEWKCNSLNERSRRAAERFGFTFEGIFRQHMVVKGRNRDTAWFSIVDGEWPGIRAALERWLAAENFDGEGRQRQALAALREAVRAPAPPAR